MKKEYDFSKSRKNPCASRLKRQITIRLDTASVDYFKNLAAELGMPYQNLINLFLRDCAAQKRQPVIHWATGGDVSSRHSSDPRALRDPRNSGRSELLQYALHRTSINRSPFFSRSITFGHTRLNTFSR